MTTNGNRSWKFALAGTVLACSAATAAFAVDLSNNLANPIGGSEDAASSIRLAGSFNTGGSAYYLSSITLMLANPTAGTTALDLYSDAGLEPAALVGTLTSPASYSSMPAATSFAGGNLALAANTNYWAVLRVLSGAFTWSWSSTVTGTGSGFRPAWALSNDAGASWYSCDNYPLQFRVIASTTPTFVGGDMNCDGVVNVQDVSPFVLALIDPAAYTAAYPGCNISYGNMNGDASVNGLDVQGFCSALLGV